MADISRGDAGEVGWSPTRIFHAARREGSSTTIGIMLVLGGAGLFLWRSFNLWALQVAIGIDLPSAVYNVLAGIVMANIICFELLRHLVSNRRKVTALVCCGLRWVLRRARAACTMAARAVLRTAVRVIGNAANVLMTMVSVMKNTGWCMVYAVLRAAGRVLAYAVVFLKTMLSFIWKGAIVNAACFIKTKIFRRWEGAARRTNADEHDMRRPRTVNEPPDAPEAADVLPPRRRGHVGIASEEVHTPSPRMTLRSNDGPADTAEPQARSHRWEYTEGESEGTAHVKRGQHCASTPARPSGMSEMCDAPALERVQGVKRERPADDSSSSYAGSHGGLAPQRGSVGGGSRKRAAKNTSGKKKRGRSTAASEEKLASRRRIDKAQEVHCCKANPAGMVEVWVCAPTFDEACGEAVPGLFNYLPATLIQQSKKRAANGSVFWYVQPGGLDMHKEWSEEGGRVVWKVPAECLFDKAPAASGKGCNTCGKQEGRISWTPHKPERICDSCADAPRRSLQRYYDARDLGFERARACGCQGCR